MQCHICIVQLLHQDENPHLFRRRGSLFIQRRHRFQALLWDGMRQRRLIHIHSPRFMPDPRHRSTSSSLRPCQSDNPTSDARTHPQLSDLPNTNDDPITTRSPSRHLLLTHRNSCFPTHPPTSVTSQSVFRALTPYRINFIHALCFVTPSASFGRIPDTQCFV